MYNPIYPLEKYVYLCEMPKTQNKFAAVCRNNPFSTVMRPAEAWSEIERHGIVATDMWYYHGTTQFICVVYLGTNYGIFTLSTVPFVRVLIGIWDLTMGDA